MKKLFTYLLAGMFLLQTTAFADSVTELVDILSTPHENATINFDMQFELNKPMDFLSAIQDFDEESRYYPYQPGDDAADMQLITESLLKSSANMTMKFNSSDNQKKVNMEILGDFILPLQINENWKSTNDMSFGLWINTDTSDLENFQYEITLKSPLSKKYIHIDFAKLIQTHEILNENQPYQQDIINELQKQQKHILSTTLKDSAKTEKKDSKYIISFDNSSLMDFCIKYISATMDTYKNIFEKYAVESNEDLPADTFTIPPEAYEAINKIKNLKILGDKGIVIEIDTSAGHLSDMKIISDIDINIYDILTYFELDIPEFITKDNSYISFTSTAEYNYSNIGSTFISKPEINDKNCHFLPEDANSEVEEELDFEKYYNSTFSEFSDNAYGYCVNGLNSIPYIHLRNMVDDYVYKTSIYTYNEINYALTWDNRIITITGNDFLPFNTIILNTKTDEVFKDGIKVELPPSAYKHIIIAYNNTYISPELAKAILGIEIYEYTINFNKFGSATLATVYYKYPNPNYIPKISDL